MRIFVAGATGVLGRRVVRRLVAAGHEVVGLARSVENERKIAELGAAPRRADLFDAGSVADAANGCEVVMHLATAIPPGMKSRRSQWATNDRIRREGTANLLSAARGATLYVQQSVALIYGTRKGLVRETTEPARSPHAFVASAVDMEAAVERSGLPAAVLRCGLFYAADDPRTQRMVADVRAGRIPIVGEGTQLVSWVHVDDAAAAFAAAVEKGAPGVWNIADDRPVTMKEFLPWLAGELRAKSPWTVPGWVAWLRLGPTMYSAMTTSLAVDNGRAKDDLGWKPQWPTFREGWKAVAKELVKS